MVRFQIIVLRSSILKYKHPECLTLIGLSHLDVRVYSDYWLRFPPFLFNLHLFCVIYSFHGNEHPPQRAPFPTFLLLLSSPEVSFSGEKLGDIGAFLRDAIEVRPRAVPSNPSAVPQEHMATKFKEFTVGYIDPGYLVRCAAGLSAGWWFFLPTDRSLGPLRIRPLTISYHYILSNLKIFSKIHAQRSLPMRWSTRCRLHSASCNHSVPLPAKTHHGVGNVCVHGKEPINEPMPCFCWCFVSAGVLYRKGIPHCFPILHDVIAPTSMMSEFSIIFCFKPWASWTCIFILKNYISVRFDTWLQNK